MRAVRHIGLGSFLHSLEVVRLATRLERQYANSRFEPERRLRRARGLVGRVLGAGHMPDGLLWLPGADKAIAVEVELSAKARSRLKKIIDRYRYSMDYDGVWYFVRDQRLADRVRAAGGTGSLFRIEVLP